MKCCFSKKGSMDTKRRGKNVYSKALTRPRGMRWHRSCMHLLHAVNLEVFPFKALLKLGEVPCNRLLKNRFPSLMLQPLLRLLPLRPLVATGVCYIQYCSTEPLQFSFALHRAKQLSRDPGELSLKRCMRF